MQQAASETRLQSYSFLVHLCFGQGVSFRLMPPGQKDGDGGGGVALTSCQPHRVTSGRERELVWWHGTTGGSEPEGRERWGDGGRGGWGRIGGELLPAVKATRRVGLIAWGLRRLLGSVACL